MRGRNSVLFVLLALAVAGCGGPAQSTAPAQPTPDFVRHANAVQAGGIDGQPSATSGVDHLVPVGSCAIGLGRAAGEVANWTGNADCTSFKRPEGASLAAASAVAMPDGSVLGANTVLQRLNPDGTVTALADLHVGDGRPNSIVRSGDRLVIGGGQTTGDKSSPLMWASNDGGKTVTPAQLPAVNGFVGPMAADGNTVVAVEQIAEDGQLGIWRSVDSGQSWQLTKYNAGKATPMITNLLRTPHAWLIVGTGEDEDPAGRPFLASSADGVAWQVVDTSKLSPGQVTGATVTKSGDVVLIGNAQTAGSQFGCSVAWTGPADSLRRVDLACDEPAKAVTTLADGRVLVVGASSVWVRSS